MIIDDTVSDLTISSSLANGHYQLNSLTIASGVTINLLSASPRLGFNSFLNNAGLIQIISGGRTLAQDASGSVGYFINSGTIQAVGTGAQLNISATVNNAGGLLRAGNGGALNFNGSRLITGGDLHIEAGSSFKYENVQSLTGQPFTLSSVNFNNEGHLNWSYANVNRHKNLVIDGGVFTNSGTVSYIVSGSNGEANPYYDYDLKLNGEATVTNSGVMLFRNTGMENTARTSFSYDEYVSLTVSLTGTGSFTNSGYIEIYNNTIGVTSGASGTKTQYTALTVNDGEKFTNTGTVSVSLGADTLDDAQHYAMLKVNTNWTNHGTVLIDGADKTLAEARLDLTGQTYTAAAGSLTELAGGGQIIANAVNLSGTIAGMGEILAATTVSAGGVLAPSGTLTLTGDLTVSGGTLEFDGAANSFLYIDGDVDFTGGILSVSNIDLTSGNYLLADYTGSLLGQTLTISGVSDAVLDFATGGKIYLAIPEPSVWALLLTGGALLAVLRRRR
ncbi:MAG: PEP-CTERM sorting domain-containing protein [Verrucomicrobiales bacterium]|nr:PEP-CTERM sorting domain-containing protein [Verrucomicrobiales bacterium]